MPVNNYYAIQAGHPKVIKTLFQYSDLVAPCVPNNEGITPLMAAIDNKQQEIIDVLLPISKNLSFIDKYGAGVLHYAVANNNLKLVESLLGSKEIKINLQDEDGITPLIEAVEQGSEALVTLLLPNGADKLLKTEKGSVPIVYYLRHSLFNYCREKYFICQENHVSFCQMCLFI